MTLKRLCSTAEVSPGAGFRAEIDGVGFAVFNLEGRFYVTADLCSHGPGSLAEGFILDDEIECPFHQGRFHIPTGRPTEAPCTLPVRVWTVHVADGEVMIDPDEPPR